MFFCFFHLVITIDPNISQVKCIRYISTSLHENQNRDLLFNQNNITLFFTKIDNIDIDVLEITENGTIFLGNINTTNKKSILVFGDRILALKIRPETDSFLTFFMFDNYYCPFISIYSQSQDNESKQKKSQYCSLAVDTNIDAFEFKDFVNNKTIYYGTQKQRDAPFLDLPQNYSFFYDIKYQKNRTYFMTNNGIIEDVSNIPFHQKQILIPDFYFDDLNQVKKNKEKESLYVNGSRWKMAVELIKQNATLHDENKDFKVKLVMNRVLFFILVGFICIVLFITFLYMFLFQKSQGYVNIDDQEKIQNL